MKAYNKANTPIKGLYSWKLDGKKQSNHVILKVPSEIMSSKAQVNSNSSSVSSSLVSSMGASLGPVRIDPGELMFLCFTSSGYCGAVSGSISSAITSGSSFNSLDCSSGV